MTELKNNLSDYTENEFLSYVEKIYGAELPEEEEDKLINHFKKIVSHPKGTDLIFWPSNNQEDSPNGVISELKRWYAEQGLPCFKE
ncbi:bacteriocin immunity protein [Enterovibrio norvegicus]|uniref:Colicin immunity protein / pyocin immunity protein n=1 Tax=Enterovibrio norvegicus DSM 15893 TaxID=1121869 RepID=A0A1I5XTU7_9GAMM|nr:bacteriocin immunity protein [Enterovibrio norvegicus]SFQ35157.1 Colicin immunity protein / pyocin immunity protein [Enterovibrio norvegicus DSM 15893]